MMLESALKVEQLPFNLHFILFLFFPQQRPTYYTQRENYQICSLNTTRLGTTLKYSLNNSSTFPLTSPEMYKLHNVVSQLVTYRTGRFTQPPSHFVNEAQILLYQKSYTTIGLDIKTGPPIVYICCGKKLKIIIPTLPILSSHIFQYPDFIPQEA